MAKSKSKKNVDGHQGIRHFFDGESNSRQISPKLKNYFYIFSKGSITLNIILAMTICFFLLPLQDYQAFQKTNTTEGVVKGSGWAYSGLFEIPNTIRYTDFYFSVNGQRFDQVSFTNEPKALKANEKIEVEYNTNNPTYARIKGQYYNETTAWYMTFFLVYIILILFYFYRAMKNKDYFQALTDWKYELATIESCDITHNSEGQFNHADLVFTYMFDGSAYKLSKKVYQKNEMLSLTDEENEIVFVNPNKPESALLLDELPLPVTINQKGEWLVDQKNIGLFGKIFSKSFGVGFFFLIAIYIILW